MNDSVDHIFEELDAMYSDRSYIQRLKVMLKGFRAPRASKEYKEAAIEAQRLSAPVAAVLLPLLTVALLGILSNSPPSMIGSSRPR
jgi:hypothetical protein